MPFCENEELASSILELTGRSEEDQKVRNESYFEVNKFLHNYVFHQTTEFS